MSINFINILIMGAFKTGTHTLYSTLLENLLNDNCIIDRSHIDEDKLIQNNYNILIFTFRNDNKILPSTFFQDILTDVSYEPFGTDIDKNRQNFLAEHSLLSEDEKQELILNTPIEKLVDFYYNIFMSYKVQPTMDECRYLYEKIYNIKLDLNKSIQFFEIDTKKLIFLDINYFEENIKSIFDFINIKYKDNLQIYNSNIGNDKWYGNKYKEFLSYLNL